MAEIERRSFTKIGEAYVELEDFRLRHPEAGEVRTWSCFAAFFPDVDASTLRNRISARGVDFVPSVKPFGVWLTGGHWFLEEALRTAAPTG